MFFPPKKISKEKDDIDLAKSGDSDAFVRLMEAHKLSLYKVGKSYLKSDEDVADAMQETILKAFHSIHKVRENLYFKTWLTRIMIHECINILRKSQRIIPVEEFASDLLIKEEKFYEGQGIFEQVQKLPKEMAQVIVLVYYEDHSCQTISKMLGIPESTVRTRLNRGRNRLRNLLRLEGDQADEKGRK